MKANELRIGNKVDIYGNVATIVPNDFEKWIDVKNNSYVMKNLKPIELTEEWLIRFGFKKMNYKLLNKIVFYSETWDIEFSDNEFYMPDIGIVVKYVHQLQNLYFALTNEELSI